jgi:hypothetical protein
VRLDDCPHAGNESITRKLQEISPRCISDLPRIGSAPRNYVDMLC